MLYALLYTLACSGEAPPAAGPAPAAASAGPVSGDTLIVASPFDPGNLNPLVAPYALSGYYIDLTQPGLAERVVTEAGLEYAPALAEAWTWSEAGDALTYTLREGLVWDDGAPLTSADVAFTWALIADPAVASNWHDDSKYITAVETPDPRTVTFRFTQAGNKQLLQGYTMRGVLPEHVLADADRATLRGHAYSKAPSASGPWKVARWTTEEVLVLEPNPKSAVQPHLDRIVTRILPEYTTRLIELQNGAVDLLFSVEIPDVPTLRASSPQIRLITQEAEMMWYVGWNFKDPRLADRSVREALTHAIDRQKIIRDLYAVGDEVFARPCVGTIAPTLGPWHNDELTPPTLDLERSRALLTEAGWTDTDGDGVVDKDGQPLVIELMIQNTVPRTKKLAVLLQAQLREVGVTLQIEMLEPNRFSALARDHDFQAILWAFGANPKVDPYIQWHSQGQYNWMSYADPETDALLEGIKAATELEEAQALAREVQARVADAHVASFLLWEDQVMAVHERFQDVEVNNFNQLLHAERWWVPADQQKYSR
ncbi:MAG: hypothetical protein H6740_24555 [Alphaproteobacteria bacterium]|nr:hypothetical protein [Alphaproteobacteria bacterium]